MSVNGIYGWNDASKEKVVRVTDDGNLTQIPGFVISDIDDAASPNYYGFLGSAGEWYILKEDTTAKTYRYCRGTSDYTTAWTGRVGLSYDYYNVVF